VTRLRLFKCKIQVEVRRFAAENQRKFWHGAGWECQNAVPQTAIEEPGENSMKNLLIVLMAFALAGTAMASDDEKDGAEAGPAVCPETQATTVFVKDKTGSRDTGSAERLTETHRQVEGKGWSFSDLEPYIEDGDLKGFFVTYTRVHSCNNN
jgi:hypothetical protein